MWNSNGFIRYQLIFTVWISLNILNKLCKITICIRTNCARVCVHLRPSVIIFDVVPELVVNLLLSSNVFQHTNANRILCINYENTFSIIYSIWLFRNNILLFNEKFVLVKIIDIFMNFSVSTTILFRMTCLCAFYYYYLKKIS